MKPTVLILIAILLSGCAAKRADPLDDEPRAEASAALPTLGSAPELTNEVWLNVEEPLRLADLRGKVVLLDMWTFG